MRFTVKSGRDHRRGRYVLVVGIDDRNITGKLFLNVLGSLYLMGLEVNERDSTGSVTYIQNIIKVGKGISDVAFTVLVLRTSLASLEDTIGITKSVLRSIIYCGSLFWIQLTVSR